MGITSGETTKMIANTYLSPKTAPIGYPLNMIAKKLSGAFSRRIIEVGIFTTTT
jgi:hypothetical protein